MTEDLFSLVKTSIRKSNVARVRRRSVDRELRDAARAERQAGEGDWRAALQTVRDATAQLQRALGAAGLDLPGEAP